jgi:hypothetical protein
MDQTPLWERIADALAKLGTFLLGAAAVWGVLWGVMKGLPKLFNHAKIVAELLRERDERRNAQEAARDYRIASEKDRVTAETYQRLYDAQRRETFELRDEIKREREDRDMIRAQMNSAFLFLVDVIGHFKGNGVFADMPPIPDDLQEGIAHAMSERARKLRGEAVKEQPPFSAPPEGGIA